MLLRWDDTEFARPDGIWWEPNTVTHQTVIDDLELGGDVCAWFGVGPDDLLGESWYPTG
jgi:hypothetical protein